MKNSINIYDEYRKILDQIHNEIKINSKLKRENEKIINWYEQFSIDHENTNIMILEKELGKLKAEIKYELEHKHAQQSTVRRLVTMFKGNEVVEKKAVDIVKIEKKIKSKSREINKFEAIDIQALKNENKKITEALEKYSINFSLLQNKINRIEDFIKGDIENLKEFEERKVQIQKDIDLINKIKTDLNAAEDSHARALIHQECEKQFENSNPIYVSSKLYKDLSNARRNISKIKKRISIQISKGNAEIKTLIIDGSNICYSGYGEDHSFKGILPLESIVKELKQNYSLIIFLDRSTFEKMDIKDDNALEIAGIKCEISPKGKPADSFIISLAENKKDTWILSNDEFVEFATKEPVVNNRVIHYIHVAQRIVIDDIDAIIDY